jgi:glutaredoxin-like protein
MEKFFNAETHTKIADILKQMVKPVTILLFTDEGGCETCAETTQLLKEFQETNSKIGLELLDIKKDAAKAEQYGITLTPSFVMLDDKGTYKGVKFNGIPAGHEINSFISALIEMSGLEIKYPADVLARIQKIDKPVNIKVFITLSCPHCPGAVQTAHRLAMLNPNVKAEMIEANTFQELSMKFKVSGVPKIIINDGAELLGNQPVDKFLSEIERL